MLGIVLTPYGQIPGAPPWEIGYSYGGDGTFLCPDDPYYNQRGEVGFFHDTQLGGVRQPLGLFGRMRAKRIAKALYGLGSIPTNFDLAPTYGWVPMIDSMVAAKEGYTVGTWIPPNGYQPGPYSPMSTPGYGAGLGFLRDSTGSTVTPATAPPVVSTTGTTPNDVQAAANAAASAIDATLQAHQDRMFKLTIVSTAVVALSAMVATIRSWRQIKRDERAFEHLEKKLGV